MQRNQENTSITSPFPVAQRVGLFDPETLAGIFEHMLNGMAYCRMFFEDGQPSDFVYLYTNPAFERLTGRKDVTGKRVSEVIPGLREAEPELFEIYGRVARGGQSEVFETYVESLGKWYAVSVFSPKSEHFVAVFDVITQRKQNELALQKSQERYQALYEATPAMLHSIDATGKILNVSREWLRILGYTRDEVIGRKSVEFLTEESRKYALDTVLPEFFRVGRCDNVPYQMITKNGRVLDVLLSAICEHDSDGNITQSLAVIQDITERKKAETLLRDSEERFRTLADFTYDWEYWQGTDQEIVYMTPSCERITGHAPAEFTANPRLLYQIIHPDDLHLMEQHVENCMHEDEATVDFRIVRPDGGIRWISHACRAVYGSAGEFKGRRASNRDMSARVEAEALLKESEEKFRLISSSAKEAILIMTQGELISYWNPAAQSIFGYTEEEAVGRQLHDLIAPRRFHADFRKGFEKFSTSGEGPIIGKTLELPALHKNGQEIQIELSVSAFQIKGLWQAVGVIRDITERKEKEQALFEAEERFRLTFESASIGMALVSLDRHILQANSALCWLLGYSQEELLQKTLPEITHPDDLETDRNYIRQLLSGERLGYHIEKRFLHCKGHIVWIQLSASVVVDVKTHQLSFVVQVQDVSERKIAVEALRQLNETLDQRVTEEVKKNLEQEQVLIQQSKYAAMGEMIGNIAHQWRQPLNALGLLLANIKDANDFNELDTAMIEKSAETGRQLIDKMAHTIDDFRNFFKPNKAKEDFSLEQAVQEAVGFIAQSLKHNNIDVQIAGQRDVRANGFPNEFSQVLLNVLNNAKDALSENQVENPHIVVELGCSGDLAWVDIRDNAGGISDEHLPKVFDAYFTTKEKGTGIGLYMSRMIMEHMGGKMEVRNCGHGAAFQLTLPRHLP